jgi:hypothetical protein
MISYLAFVSELNGQPMRIGDSLQGQIVSDIVKAFPSMRIEQKKLLCSAGLLWQLMEYNWNRLDASQKQQFRSQFTGNRSVAASGQTPAYSSGQSQQKKSASQQMADYQARQNCMKMMMDMNTMTHATSLNIIENIGGTGNYWEVVNY